MKYKGIAKLEGVTYDRNQHKFMQNHCSCKNFLTITIAQLWTKYHLSYSI